MMKKSTEPNSWLHRDEGAISFGSETVRLIIRQIGEAVTQVRLRPIDERALATVQKLDSGAYGVSVRRELNEVLDRPVSVGTVYATLARLEHLGLVHFEMGEATKKRGGKRKRYARITREGQQLLSLLDAEPAETSFSVEPAR